VTWFERIRELVAAGFVIVGVGMGAVLAPSASGHAHVVRIGAFNIQILGNTTLSKEPVMDILARTAREFDVLLVQEVKDSRQEVADRFLDRINQDVESQYAMIEGPRVGRSASGTEQYVIYYRPALLTFVDSFTLPDPDDRFARDPLVATFRAGTFDFRIVGVHIKPDDASDELAALSEVADAIVNESEGDVILLGDFNADCQYFSESNMAHPLRASRYHWVIGDDAETAVKTGCTFDRIILLDGTFNGEFEPNSAQVFRFDLEFNIEDDRELVEDVSDHYPVYAEFRINGPDDDGTTPATSPGGGAPFVGSRNGHTYYKTGCNAARRLTPGNVIEFSSAQAAEAQSYQRSRSAGC
jgi:deoxyribonuclease-1